MLRNTLLPLASNDLLCRAFNKHAHRISNGEQKQDRDASDRDDARFAPGDGLRARKSISSGEVIQLSGRILEERRLRTPACVKFPLAALRVNDISCSRLETIPLAIVRVGVNDNPI